MTPRMYRWLAHQGEWQGRPAHAFVDGNARAMCRRAARPPTPVQVYCGNGLNPLLCKVCTAMLENALDMQEAKP